jgi:hypothetical protein
MKAKKPKKPFDTFVRYSNIAFQMAAVIGLGVFAGIRLDRYTGLEFPLLTLVLSLGSVVAAIYIAVKDFLS